jgi:RNA polymerase sigma factor (sigma-70 family)
MLFRTALRLTHNRAEAEDLVQETYLRARRSFHRFDPGSNCRAWLLTIMRNLFLNRLRQQGREMLESDLTSVGATRDQTIEPVPDRDTPEEASLHTVLYGDVDRALKGLPLAFREAVVLADLEVVRVAPGFYIKQLIAYVDEQQVSEFQLTSAISANPLFRFLLRLRRSGTMRVVFVNSEGQRWVISQIVQRAEV